MNKLKGWITLTLLTSLLTLSATTAKAGIIATGASPCTEPGTEKVETKDDFGGIIVTGVVGIIVTGFTGIIVTGVTDEPAENCGIIVTG
jgi:hypothetical protein